jgi:hypothetical protein
MEQVEGEMQTFAAMKRNPVPPKDGGHPAAPAVAGGGRRSPQVSIRSPILYLATLRRTAGNPMRHDKSFGRKP